MDGALSTDMHCTGVRWWSMLNVALSCSTGLRLGAGTWHVLDRFGREGGACDAGFGQGDHTRCGFGIFDQGMALDVALGLSGWC